MAFQGFSVEHRKKAQAEKGRHINGCVKSDPNGREAGLSLSLHSAMSSVCVGHLTLPNSLWQLQFNNATLSTKQQTNPNSLHIKDFLALL